MSGTAISNLSFDCGLDIQTTDCPMGFRYGRGVFGPQPELRTLGSIRKSLRDPQCQGPDPVYSIVMDVGRDGDRAKIQSHMLLFGVVVYAGGTLGREPVRSQGHVHAIAPHCGWSTPELFEVWEGKAIVYAQESAGDEPGRCIAIEAGPGDQIVVPPRWAHFVVNADTASRMVFGAWCDRQYGFEYAQVRAHHGLAWFPLLGHADEITWEANPLYAPSKLRLRKARSYPELGVSPAIPIYQQFVNDPNSVQWVSEPGRLADLWKTFEP